MVIATSDGNVYESDTHMAVETAAKPDYDYAAFKASGMDQADNGHYPDTFKLPNHITFSDQSMYHGVDGNEGGQWNQLEGDRWSFTPGATNFKNHSLPEMIDYFKKYEPGNVLNAVAGDVVPLPINPFSGSDRRSTKEEAAQFAVGDMRGSDPKIRSIGTNTVLDWVDRRKATKGIKDK